MSFFDKIRSQSHTLPIKEPRPSKIVYDLRRNGLLDEARQRAETLLLQNETDDDLRKAYAWTLIDIIKQEQEKGNKDAVRQIVDILSNITFATANDTFTRNLLSRIRSLKLQFHPFYPQIKEAKEFSLNGNNDQAWAILSGLAKTGNLPIESHEEYGWVIYHYLHEHHTDLSSVQVRTLLRDYIQLQNDRPSELHSRVLGFALSYSKNDDTFNLVSFLRLWNPNNLTDLDLLTVSDKEGNTIPSRFSRIAKALVRYPTKEVQKFIELIPNLKDDFIELLEDQYFWKIYHNTENNVDASSWMLFNQYLDLFSNAPASSSHSRVLGLAERLMKDQNAWRFYDFFRRWGPSQLRTEDWQEENGSNGETYKPLALKSLKKAKDALEALSDEQIGDLQWLIDLYDIAVRKFPDDDWNIRSKAKLHRKAGQLEKARDIYKELCLKMGEKYYIWQEFADCCEDPSLKIALLCKALSLEKNEDFLGKIRLDLARQLILFKNYSHALTELKVYKEHYSEKGWHLDSEVDKLIEQCGSATPTKDNNALLYSLNIPLAEELAYADIPFSEVVLVHKWKNNEGKGMMAFVDDTIEFATNNKRFPILRNSHVGQVWKFKLYREDSFKTVPSVKPHRPPKTIKVAKYIPLIAAPSEKEDWASLPLKYGYVQHVNTEKKSYHIYSTDSILVYEHYDHQDFVKGDFVKFRQYSRIVKEEKQIFFRDIQKCDKEEALSQFNYGVAAVDDVNPKQQLFHFELGPGKGSGLLHYDQTELRPTIGDCIKIGYFIRKIEDKKHPGSQREIVEVLKAELSDEIDPYLVKVISGELVLKYRNGNKNGVPDFAFIDEYYVHKSILEKYHLTEDDYHVSARVVYSGGGEWKVYEIL